MFAHITHKPRYAWLQPSNLRNVTKNERKKNENSKPIRGETWRSFLFPGLRFLLEYKQETMFFQESKNN